jgi:PKD repeat protein
MALALGLCAPAAEAAPTPPQVSSSWTPALPRTATPVQFSAGATDPDKGPITGWAWDFNGDGVVDSTAQNPMYPGFAAAGDHVVKLTVTDHDGERTVEEHTLHVHDANLPPRAANLYAQPLGPRVLHPTTLRCDCTDPDADPRLAAPVTYDWDFGDGTAHSAAAKPSHSYATSGTHVVRLRITDPDGSVAINTLTVTAHTANQPPVVTGAPTLVAKAGTPTSLTVGVVDDASPGSALTYDWNFGDGSAHATTAAPSHTYSTAGDYVVRVRVTDADGGSTYFSQVVRFSRPPGTPAAAFSTAFDLNSAFYFESSGAAPATNDPVLFEDGSADTDGGSIVGHAWDFGDGTTSTASSPTHAFATGGDHVVVLTATDNQGKISRYAEVMHVHASNLPPSAAIGASLDEPRTGGSVDLISFVEDPDMPGAAGATYDWNFGDGTPHSTEPNPSHTWTAAGDYDLLLTVTDSGGAVTQAAVTLHVHDDNLTPEAHPSSDPAYPNTGQVVQFFDNSSDFDGRIVTYSWDFGDGTTGTGPQPTHTYGAPGDYHATETVTDDDGASTTEIVSIHVGPVPPANVTPPSVGGLARDRQTLTADAGAWSGTAPFLYVFEWVRCDSTGAVCTVIPGATVATVDTTASYLLGESDIGHVIKTRLTVANVAGSATALSPTTSPVAEVPPENVAAPSITGSLRDGQVMTADPGTWAHTGALAYSYRWQRCGANGGGCADIQAATGSTYRLAFADEGSTVRVQVTGTDAHGSATASSPASTSVAPGPPVKLSDPTVAGTPRDGATLTEDDGTYAGSPTSSVTRTWQRCDANGAGCADVATGTTYALSAADVGHRVRAVVLATNPQGSDSGTSAPTAVVAPAPATALAAPTVTGLTTDGQTLTSDQGTFSGTPTINYAYRWERCDAAGLHCSDIQSGGAGATYVLTSVDVGRRLRVRVIASNAGGTAVSESSPTAVIAAVPPTTVGPPVISGRDEEGAPLISTPGSYAGTTPQVAYQWRRCDPGLLPSGGATGCADLPGETSSAHRLTSGDVGHRLLVVATATNAAGSATAASSPTAIVAEGRPTAVTPPRITGAARTGGALIAEAGAFAGTPTITYALHWRRCAPGGTACSALLATGARYTPGPADLGHSLQVQVVASNAHGSDSALSAPTTVIVLDPAPVRSALRAALAPRSRASVPVVLGHGGYTGTFVNRFGPGSVELDWYARGGRRPALVARGRARLRGASRRSVAVRLTGTGRRLLRRGHGPLRLAGRASFRSSTGMVVRVARTIALRVR